MATWLERYDFNDDKVIERTEKMLEKFDIKKYHFVADGSTLALIVEINLNTYKLEIDDYKEEMVIRKKKYRRREQRQPKEYLSIVKSFKSDCIYNSITWVVRDSKSF